MVKVAAADKAQKVAEKAAADALGELGTLQLQLQSTQAEQAKAAEWADDFEQRVADAVKGEASWHLSPFSMWQGLLGEPTSYMLFPQDPQLMMPVSQTAILCLTWPRYTALLLRIRPPPINIPSRSPSLEALSISERVLLQSCL